MNNQDLIQMIPMKKDKKLYLVPANARLKQIMIWLQKYKYTVQELEMLKTEIINLSARIQE